MHRRMTLALMLLLAFSLPAAARVELSGGHSQTTHQDWTTIFFAEWVPGWEVSGLLGHTKGESAETTSRYAKFAPTRLRIRACHVRVTCVNGSNRGTTRWLRPDAMSGFLFDVAHDLCDGDQEALAASSTFPGFMMRCGSSAALIVCIIASSTGSL